MLNELYTYTTIISILLVVATVIFQTRFPEIFSEDKPLIDITVDISDSKRILILIAIAFLLITTPIINYLFALVYSSGVVYRIIKYRMNNKRG